VHEQGGHVRRVVRVQADPDARRHEHLGAVDLEGVCQGVADPPGHRLRVQQRRLHVADLAALQVPEQDQELVGSAPGERVGLADRAGQALGDGLEEPVAALHAERVVHELEVVQVQRQHRDRQVAAVGAGQSELVTCEHRHSEGR
jgi:hypothetical protein